MFRFFRRAMHTKTLGTMVAHVLHALYIALLGYIVIAHQYNEVEPQLFTFALKGKPLGSGGIVKQCCHSNKAAELRLMKETLEKKQKYFQLLQLEQYRDSHKTKVDKRTDLRKDLFAKLAEKVQKMQKGKKKGI